MVETALFPRPNFATFLRSDDSTDPLSYYEYQRLQRTQKVARLQERRSKTYEPGYKKPFPTAQASSVPHVSTNSFTSGSSRQIFTRPSLNRQDQATVSSEHAEIPKLRQINKEPSPAESRKQNEKVVAIPSITKEPQRHGIEIQEKLEKSEKLPKTVERRFSRPVKSATVKGNQRPMHSSLLLPRPQTARVPTKDVGTSTQQPAITFQIPGRHKQPGDTQLNDSWEEDGTRIMDIDDTGDDSINHTVESTVDQLKENMAQAYQWTTSTQRGYNGVDWGERLPPSLHPPTTTVEQFPDPVSQKLTFRRYNSCPEPWQVYGPEWDYVQTRFSDLQHQEPSNLYIPGYTGYVPTSGGGEVDHPLLARLLVRRLTPRSTKISKKTNIPGYTGHTHWSRMNTAHSDLKLPNPLTTARTHREFPLEEDTSPFRRTSPLSKTITLVSPYNPFNKIDY